MSTDSARLTNAGLLSDMLRHNTMIKNDPSRHTNTMQKQPDIHSGLPHKNEDENDYRQNFVLIQRADSSR